MQVYASAQIVQRVHQIYSKEMYRLSRELQEWNDIAGHYWGVSTGMSYCNNRQSRAKIEVRTIWKIFRMNAFSNITPNTAHWISFASSRVRVHLLSPPFIAIVPCSDYIILKLGGFWPENSKWPREYWLTFALCSPLVIVFLSRSRILFHWLALGRTSLILIYGSASSFAGTTLISCRYLVLGFIFPVVFSRMIIACEFGKEFHKYLVLLRNLQEGTYQKGPKVSSPPAWERAPRHTNCDFFSKTHCRQLNKAFWAKQWFADADFWRETASLFWCFGDANWKWFRDQLVPRCSWSLLC